MVGIKRMMGVGLLALLSTPGIALSQIPVTDAGNLVQNVIQAAQSVVTAGHMATSVTNQALELLPVEEIVLAGEFYETLGILGDMIVDAQGLAYDINSLQDQIATLFNLDTAPDTKAGFDQRVADIKTFKFNALCYAMRTQTLIQTLLHALGHVDRLVNQIGVLTGNLSSNTVLIQSTASLNVTLTTLTTMTAAAQRTDAIDKMERAVLIESLHRIQATRFRDWPRAGR